MGVLRHTRHTQGQRPCGPRVKKLVELGRVCPQGQNFSSSKKRTNEFYFTTIKLQVDLFSFVFWKKLKTPKRQFEINWPLAVPRFGSFPTPSCTAKTCFGIVLVDGGSSVWFILRPTTRIIQRIDFVVVWTPPSHYKTSYWILTTFFHYYQ